MVLGHSRQIKYNLKEHKNVLTYRSYWLFNGEIFEINMNRNNSTFSIEMSRDSNSDEINVHALEMLQL